MKGTIQIRPGLKITCNTEEEMRMLMAYLDSLGYFWRDGRRLICGGDFGRIGEGKCFLLRERDGAKTVVIADAGEDAVGFAEIAMSEAGGSGIDCLMNHPEVAVHCATVGEAEALVRMLRHCHTGGAMIFLRKYREGRADCCRVAKTFGGMPCVEWHMRERYLASKKYRTVEYSELFGGE